MKLNILNIEGKETGREATLNETIFGIEPNDHAIYLDVKQHLANKRQGTHKAKSRGEVAGSTRKIKKQKGTGGARAGNIRNPLFKKGGRVFGPIPRDYEFKLNKKVKQLARKSALSYKFQDQGIVVVEDFNLDEIKTKKIVSILKNLDIDNKKTLVVLSNTNKNIYLSARNLQNTKVVTVSELSTYNIMNASKLLLFESSIPVIEKNFIN